MKLRWLLVALAACHEKPPPPSLLGDVKSALARREGKLAAWSFKARVDPGGGAYAVTFREPSSTRLDLPTGALSFDGHHFYERNDEERTLTVHTPALSASEVAVLWSETFGQQVPEGFRAPLLPPVGVSARAVDGAVELELRTTDEGKDVTVVSVLRWPGGDFLERRTDYGGARGTLRMDKEQCDAKLELCIPTQLSRWEGDTKVETTTLTDVQLGLDAPRDAFVLTAPEGYAKSETQLASP